MPAPSGYRQPRPQTRRTRRVHRSKPSGIRVGATGYAGPRRNLVGPSPSPKPVRAPRASAGPRGRTKARGRTRTPQRYAERQISALARILYEAGFGGHRIASNGLGWRELPYGASPGVGERGTRVQSLPTTRVPTRSGYKLGPATIPTSPAGVGREILRSTSPIGLASRVPGFAGDAVRNAFEDTIDIPAQFVPSTYATVRAGVNAARGDSAEARKLWKDFTEHDALALLAQRKPGKAAKAFYEHPVATGLEVWGLGAGASRLAGRAARSPRVGTARSRAYASRERESARYPGTRMEQRREYPEGLAGNRMAKRKERKAIAEARAHREQGVRLVQQGFPDEAKRQFAAANRVDPRVMREREVTRQADEQMDVNEVLRREARSRLEGEGREALKGIEPGGVSGSLVAQNIVKASKEDLRAFAADLDHSYSLMDDGKAGASRRAANRELRRKVQEVIDGNADLRSVEQAVRKFGREFIDPRERELIDRELLDPAQAERRKLLPYAVRNMGARYDEKTGVVLLDGKPLSNDAIRAHMEENGFGTDPTYVSQAPNLSSAGAYWRSWTNPEGKPTRSFTGRATLEGTARHDPEALMEEAQRKQSILSAADGFERTNSKVRFREPGRDQFDSYKRAEEKARDLEAGGRGRWRPVKLVPWGPNKDRIQRLMDADEAEVTRSVTGAIEDAVKGAPSEGGPWVLWPESFAERVYQHMRVVDPGDFSKTIQALNKAFRIAVLPFRVTWPVGNFTEGQLRALVAGAGPKSGMVGRRLAGQRSVPRAVADALRDPLHPVESLRARARQPLLSEEAQARVLGGGAGAQQRRLSVHRTGEQIRTPDSGLGTAWRVAGAARRLPGVRPTLDRVVSTTDKIFEANQRWIESRVQAKMLGKQALKDFREIHNERPTISKAVEDAAQGLHGTPAQIRMGRIIDRWYGRYNKYTPGERRAMSTYAPFMAWLRNAGHFLFYVLPREHPILTAVAVADHEATRQWREDQRYGLFGDGKSPSWLQGSIDSPDWWPGPKGKLRVQRFTPFAAAQEFPGSLASVFTPQFESTQRALQGQDWTGRPYRVEGKDTPDPVDRVLFAARTFGESMVPLLAQSQQFNEAEGSMIDRLRRTFNPLEPVAPKGASDGGGGEGDIDFSKVKLPEGGSDIDWSKVKLR